MTPRFLSSDQIEHFITHGYVKVPNCFSRELAKEATDRAYLKIGYDKNNPATWEKSRVFMALDHQDEFEAYAPRAFAAAADLVGGVDMIKRPSMLYSESFIINFHEGADKPWEPASPQTPGWHKDGNWFRHFLDSPEQGLLLIFLYSDIQPRGGGTFGALDSVGVLARFLAQHPEGVLSPEFNFKSLVSECRDFVEWTGQVGDVLLLHPYMLHTVSQNHLGIPRFITNPAISLSRPMNFNRENPDDFSPLELAVLRGLGVKRYDFQPTAPRQLIVTQQVMDQAKLIEAERRNLAEALAKAS